MKVTDRDLERIARFENKMAIEVIKKGFTPGTEFISATGSVKGKVSGDIVMKWVADESSEESQFNGDLVSRGIGCIFCRRSSSWGKIL